MSVFGVFWSVYSLIWTEHGDLLCKSLYSVQMQENTGQENFEYRHFLGSVFTFKNDSIIVMANLFLEFYTHSPVLELISQNC